MNIRRTTSLLKMGRGMIPRMALLADLRRVAQETGRTTSTAYEAHGRFSYGTIKDRFGTWPHALELAGLRSAPGYSRNQQAAMVEQQILRKGLERPCTQRRCLRCEQAFDSSGPQNRLCPTCHGAIDVMGPTMEAFG